MLKVKIFTGRVDYPKAITELEAEVSKWIEETESKEGCWLNMRQITQSQDSYMVTIFLWYEIGGFEDMKHLKM